MQTKLWGVLACLSWKAVTEVHLGPPGSMPGANSLSLVRFDCNDYSVPTSFAHHKLTVIGGIEQVRIVLRRPDRCGF